MFRKLIILTFIINLSSCMDLFEYDKVLIEPYHIRTDPGDMSKSIYYNLENGNGIGRISSVNKVGWNHDHIIAINSNKHYFILEIHKDYKYYNAEEIVIGLLSKYEFLEKRKVLKIDNELEFTLVVE